MQSSQDSIVYRLLLKFHLQYSLGISGSLLRELNSQNEMLEAVTVHLGSSLLCITSFCKRNKCESLRQLDAQQLAGTQTRTTSEALRVESKREL